MSNYNSEYETYYNSLINKEKSRHINFEKFFTLKSLYKRILQELVGGFVLFSMLLVFKTNIFPGTKQAFEVTKKIVHENYDYEKIADKVSGIDSIRAEEVEKYVSDWIEQLKVKTVGGETIKEKVRNKYMLPFTTSSSNMTITTVENTKAIDIEVPENTSILSCYGGKVVSVGEDAKLGKYVEIDHGEGIIIKYENLNEATVKKDSQIKKGDIIGKSGKATTNKAPHLQLEMSYMSEVVNPMDYLNFSNKV